MIKLLSPDGYYTYLGIEKPTTTEADSSVDEELIKKNYRRLTLRHHPDRPTGDADTFRVLNRAQKVLVTAKLRQQYNLLGLDLEEDDDDHAEDSNEEEKEGDEGGSSSSTADSVMSQIASVTLASIFQSIVRTGKYNTMQCQSFYTSL